MIAKAKHKELKTKVNEVEQKRNNDRGITSWFELRELKKLKLICEKVLQPVRDHFGKVVSVSSGFRSEELCEAIGSSKNSQHAKGQAADFEIFGVSNQELVIWIDQNLDYDQMILEFWKGPDEPNSGWVHVSYKKEGNRKELLRAFRNTFGKTQYEKYEY